MTRLASAAFGITMFAVGALAVAGAQEARDKPDQAGGSWSEAVYLPIVPQVGQEVTFEKARCTVREVRREWIRCEGVPQWRNVYNGQQYTVREVPAPAP